MLKSLVSNPSRARRALFGVVALLIGGGVQTTLSLRSTAAVSTLRVGVETYTYGNAEWTLLTETGAKVGPVVISPNQGPGLTQDFLILDRVQRAQAAGQTVYGFIDVSGPKLQATIVAEANRYKSFYSVNGIYLAGVSTAATCASTDYLSLVVADIRVNVGVSKIGINAYGEPNACVETLVDLVHIPFDSPTAYATYAGLGSPAWTAGLATGSTLQIWHSVRATSTAADVTAVKTAALTTNASFLSTSDGTAGSPVALTAAYWTQMVGTIAGSYIPAPLGVGTVTTQKFAMPTYFNDGQWATLTAIGAQFSMAIVNPNSGPYNDPSNPQTTTKDLNIAARVLAAQAQGIKVIGYVSTNYHGSPPVVGNAHVPPYDVNTAVGNYLSWYGVDGVFFDETVYECSQTANLAGYVQALKASKPGALAVVNPGRNSGECLVAPTSGVGTVPGAVGADISVNFEGSAATYETWQPSFWTRNYLPEKFWHIVYSTPETAINHVVELSKLRQAGLLFATDTSAVNNGTAFSVLPVTTYLDALRHQIYGSVVNGPTTTTTSMTNTSTSTATSTSTTSATTTTSTVPSSTTTTSTTTSTSTSTTTSTTSTTEATTSTTAPSSTTSTTTTTTAAPVATPAPTPTSAPTTTSTTSTTTTTAAPTVFAPFPSGGGGGGVTITDSSSGSAGSSNATPATTVPPTTVPPAQAPAAPVQNLPIATTTLPATTTMAIPTTTKTPTLQLTYSACGVNKTTTVLNGVAGIKGTFRLLTTITCSQQPGLPAIFVSVSKVDLPDALAPVALKALAAKIKNSTKTVQGTSNGSMSTLQPKKTLTVTLKGTGNPTTENILRSLTPALTT